MLSGPSGSGKSTLVRRLLARPGLRLTVSVSATTRAPGPARCRAATTTSSRRERVRGGIRGELLESAEVHGHLYGTPAGPVRGAMAAGALRHPGDRRPGGLPGPREGPRRPAGLHPGPRLEVLEARLRARGTDDEATIQRRLANARRELELATLYDVQIVNDDLDRAVEELAAILIENGCGGLIDHDR